MSFFRTKTQQALARLGHRIACGIALALTVPGINADDAVRQRDEIRAAFVFNLARFVSWPASSPLLHSDQFNLCIYRTNYLGAAMDTLIEKSLHGRKLHLYLARDLSDIASCQILLIPGENLRDYRREAAATAQLRDILTIADFSLTPHSHRDHGGIMVTIVRKDSSLGFEVDLDAVKNSDLKMSSELLKLAVIVEDEG